MRIQQSKFVCIGGLSNTEEQIKGGQVSLNIFSDVFLYDSKSNYWEQPIIGGPYPDPRLWISVATNFRDSEDPNYGSKPELLVLGGIQKFKEETTFADQVFYILSQSNENWKLKGEQ